MFRAYCSACEWESEDTFENEDNAFEFSLNVHVQQHHAWEWGVRKEK
jgi:hypothetical protein